MKSDAKLLSEYVDLLNEGEKSKVTAFLEKHSKNDELIGCCRVVDVIRKGLADGTIKP